LAAILVAGVGQEGAKGLDQLHAGAFLRGHFQDDDASHSSALSADKFPGFQRNGFRLLLPLLASGDLEGVIGITVPAKGQPGIPRRIY
jgi:hypothetical protein